MLYQILIRRRFNTGRRDAVIKALSKSTARMRSLPGCVYSSLLRDVADEAMVTFIQEWESERAMKRHVHSEGFRALLSALEVAEAKLGATVLRIAIADDWNVPEAPETTRRDAVYPGSASTPPEAVPGAEGGGNP